MALTFFGIMVVSIFLTVFAVSSAPKLLEWFRELIVSARGYVAIPPPYTETLYFYIFLNNIGHFWNPVRMLIWVPLLGAFVLGLELLLNAVVIGVVATLAGMSRGPFYPILGLVPHGIFEIPAFILEFASIIRWQIVTLEFLMAKVTGEKLNSPKLKRGVKDTVILAVVSVILFAIAALIETYVTPKLLGL